MGASRSAIQARLPFFYGWVVVAVVFVTMGVGVNARTAFSLLFPPILDEFGWERGVTAGAFSFGFLVSAAVSPLLGRLMDRRGPRVVIELGVGLMAAGLLLAPLVSRPWHLYATLGVLVGGGSVCMGYTGQALFLPNWFVRRRGLALSLAFSGVGFGSIALLPWMETMIAHAGWRSACSAMGLLVLVLLAPLNLLLARRPEDMGLEPDGDGSAGRTARSRVSNVVDPGWAAVDWTLGRALRTTRFWWIALGYFGGLYAWYAVQVHQTKYLVEIGFAPATAAWALGLVSLAGIPGQIALGHLSDRIGREWVWTAGSLGFVLCGLSLLLLRDGADAGAARCHGRLAGNARIRAHVGHGRDSRRNLRGPALRVDLRHGDAGLHRGRRRRAMGDRRDPRRHRHLHPRLLDLHRRQRRLRRGHLARRPAQGARRRGARAERRAACGNAPPP